MAAHTIFGHPFQDFNNEQIQIIIDNPQVRAWFERHARNNHILERFQYDGSLRGKLLSLLRVASKVASIGTVIQQTLSLSNNPRDETTPSKLRKRKSDEITPDVQGTKRKFDQISPDNKAMPRMPPGLRKDSQDVTMEVDGDGEATQVQASARSSGTSSTGRTGQHGETPVSVPLMVEPTPWRSISTALHNYYAFPGPTTITPTQAAIWTYRLNSIYDCRVNTHTDVEPTLPPVAEAADATINEPPFRAHYKALYNYWTVLSSKYRIRVQITPTSEGSTTKDVEYMCYVYHHGSQRPPQYCEPTGGSNTLVTHQMRRTHKGMYYFPLRYNADLSQTRAMDLAENSAEGEWMPGSIKHEVAEDELKQIWHRQTEVPPTMEGLTIIVQRSPSSTSGVTVEVRCEVTIDYVTQYKDLQRAFQYPTQLTDDPGATDIGIQAN